MNSYQAYLNGCQDNDPKVVAVQFHNPVNVKDHINIDGIDYLVFNVKHIANRHSILDCDKC